MPCHQASGGHSSSLPKWPADQNLHQDAASNLASEREINGVELLQSQHPNTQHEYDLKSVQENNVFLEGKPNYISGIKQSLLDSSFTDEGLKKLDSFNRWMSKELGDVNESHMQTSSEAYWDTVEAENADGDSSQVRLDTYMLGPSLSQDQLFTIIDFSPNWAFEDSEVKVPHLLYVFQSHQLHLKCVIFKRPVVSWHSFLPVTSGSFSLSFIP